MGVTRRPRLGRALADRAGAQGYFFCSSSRSISR